MKSKYNLITCTIIYFLCLDIDECAFKIDNCSVYEICNNTEGSFNCSCKDRSQGNGNNSTGNHDIPKYFK